MIEGVSRRLSTALALAAAVAACATAGAVADAAGLALTDGPSGPTSDPTPTFAWSPEGAATCSVDGDDPAPCTSPLTLPELRDGAHAFEVQVGDDRAGRSFAVDTTAPSVDMGEATVAESRATFSFTAESGTDVACAVGSGDPAPCTSPFTTGDLPNGGHVVRVRATDAAGNAGEAARLAQIAVAPPDTAIAAGPEGETADARPEFTFTSTRARSGFRCRLDEGAWSACGASFRPAEPLPAGRHMLQVVAIDAAGNADPSPAEREFAVVQCQTSVAFGAVAIAGRCLRPEGDRLVSTDPIKVNGLTFNPRDKGGKGRFVIEPKARKVTLGDVQLKMGSVVLYQGDLSFAVPEAESFRLARLDTDTKTRLDAPAEGVDTEAALDLQGDDSAQVAGFPLKGEAALDLVKGTAVLSGNLELPKAFSDAEGNGLTGALKLISDNERGMRLDEAKVTAPLAFVGSLELHDLFVSFEESGAGPVSSTCNTETPGLRWEGGASAIVVPTPGRMRLEDVGVGFADGTLSHAEAVWKPTAAGGASLGGGVRVQKLAVSLCAGPPLTLAGRAALTAMPGPDGKPRLEVPNAGLIWKGGDPWSIRAEAPEASLKGGVPVTFKDLFVSVTAAGAVDFGGAASFSLDVKGDTAAGRLDAAVKVDAAVEGFIAGSTFNADLDAQGCFSGSFTVGNTVPASLSDVCTTVEGVVSSTGAAVCGGLKVKETEVGKVGAGLAWGGPLKFMAGACDVKPWRVVKPEAGASAVAASVGRSVRLPGSERGVLVAVRGVDGPPQVALSGPGGARVASAADPQAAVQTDAAVAFANVAQRTTYVVLRKPAGGRWTVAAAGATRIADVRTAGMRPPATASARVSGRGRSRVLRYSVPRRAGQRVTFVERGRRTARVLEVVRTGGRGAVAFRPADGPGGRRRIEAVVEQGGAPRDRLSLATYVAPRRSRPARPVGVKLARGTRAVEVAWGETRRAKRYGVRVSVSDGRELFFVRASGERKVRVPGVSRNRSVRVRVVGLRADNGHGPAATTQSRPVRRSR